MNTPKEKKYYDNVFYDDRVVAFNILIKGTISLVVIALVVWGILSFFGFNNHNTYEGTVSTIGCREFINLKPYDWQTYFGTFTGMTLRTHSGNVLGGVFERVETDNNGNCTRVYEYEKPQDDVCLNPDYPRLDYDDKCHPQTTD